MKRVISRSARWAAPILCAGAMILAAAAPHAAEGPWKAPPEADGYENGKSGAASVAEGRKVYEKYCILCHGKTGGGDGPSARTLQLSPASLSDKKRMTAQSDGALAWKILNGRGSMPSWAPVLVEDDIWNVINYVRTLAQ